MSTMNVMGRRGKDPSPSKWAWRFQRLMLTPLFVWMLRLGVPAMLIAGGVGYIMISPERRQVVMDAYASMRDSFHDRPEFLVHMMSVQGTTGEVSENIRENLSLTFPISTFDMDLEEMRHQILALPSVQDAVLRIRPGGELQAVVTPRVPVALWRSAQALSLLDASGAHVSYTTFRSDHPDLPLIAGAGADENVAEALQLLNIAKPLGKRVRAIQRIGERRWDVVLDRNQRIMLPAIGAGQALEYVMALEAAQDLLSRDVARVDMRIHGRPTVLLNENASQELWRIRQITQRG